ncbi:putative baseplate assembly protein [Azohydromonas aeria]|uniref:putative baseplate assembly protein n=1 Tax=Azohydromonas aeria TaxID=2590212 RepID=UPI0012F7AF82|nr:putative baseplate assembly protein [Azohydromonas aeria]
MPIRPPALDDRSFDDLVAELLARIPAHTPEWTHPRPGDPGRTLIELFAWLGDTILYRANLIPERQRLAYLRLLGMPLKPAQAARGLVCLQVKAERQAVAVQMPPGSAIDKPVPFSTLGFCTAYPVTGRAYLRRRLTPDEQADFDALLPDLQAVYRATEGRPQGYVTTEVFAPGQDLATGVDVLQSSVDGALWIALLAPSAKLLPDARQALAADAQGTPRALNVGLALALDVAAGSEALTARTPLPLAWELSTGSDAATPDVPDMVALDVLEDGSAGLTRSGVVRLALPGIERIGAPVNDPRRNLRAGVGDAPPRLESDEDAARLVTWLRLRLQPGAAVDSLRLAWAGLNAVAVEQRQALPGRAIGVSDGGSDQVMDLAVGALGSADPATLQLLVHDPVTGSAPWSPVDDLGRCGPLDHVYQLDAEAGTVRFGDGVHGRVPSTGSRVVATGLRVGGGAAGNLAAGTLSRLDAVIDLASGARRKPEVAIDVWQPLALRGGADTETLDAAERRIPAYFQHRDRAVTAADYRALAREAPGAQVARVEVLPRFKPHERAAAVPGAVSVMALPARDTQDWAAPLPRADRPLLEAVHGFLNERRPLATELYVMGCEYREIGVSVAVLVREGHAREQVLSDVRLALRRHLWPLPIGLDGADGPWPASAGSDGGYPLGRALTDRELEVVVARVAGVAGVSPLRLFEKRDGAFAALADDNRGVTTLALEAWQLPELTAVLVVEGAVAPGSMDDPFAGAGGQGGSDGQGGGGAALYLPVVPEFC